jgi:hypothetical protein
MNPLLVLAKSSPQVIEDVEVVPIDLIWNQIASLSWFHAIVAISFGIVYLLYGWRIFKVLAVICFGMIGLFGGMYFGERVDNALWGGIIGLVVLAIVSIPLMKWSICILGALAGGTLTAAIWYAFELPQLYMWAGGAVGLVAGGMISFIIFKIAVMLFTSMGGSITMMAGVLALLHQFQLLSDPNTTAIYDSVHNQAWFLPAVLILPTIIGVYTQNRLIKDADKWEL